MSMASPRKGPSVGVALILGLPLAAGVLALFRYGPLHGTLAARYVEHPAQWVTVAFFCVGIASLLHRLLRLRGERAALRAELLPVWDGKPMPVSAAAALLDHAEKHRLSGSWLGRRVCALLGFVKQRGAADEVDDQLRALGDVDAGSHDAGYSFLRFVTWAIPIVGFLGTVLGITTAISGVNPEAMENNMSSLTGGLAEAFDSTALALGLTMVLMFFTNLVERSEQAVLDTVDLLAEEMLAHRFVRHGAETAPVVDAIHRQTAAMVEAHAGPMAQLIEMLQMRMMSAMQQAMGDCLTQFAHHTGTMVQQLTGLAQAIHNTGTQQQAALMRVAEGIATQAAVLSKVQQDEANLVHLQAVLHQNLAAIAGATDFEQAVHSLTAAVHMLTTRAAAPRLSLHGAAA
jgi:biopolymer transport protein ExbB/TolQ